MRKAILLTSILLAGCSNYPTSLPSIKPYRMDIQQGNVVTPKMMMQLRPGMTKAQVRFVMGTPLITDSFHANRWDYFYSMQKDGKIIEQRRIILDFENDKLLHVRGDVIPASSNGDTQAGDRPANKEPVMLKPANGAAPKKEEKGMLDKLKFWKDDDEKAPAKVDAKPATTAPATEEEKLPVLPPLMETPTAEPAAATPKPVVKSEPKAAPAPKQEEKGLLDKLQFWKSDDEKPSAKPEAKPVPKADPGPTAAPNPEVKPVPSAEPKPIPKPQENLPSEEDPSYFDRMLEKIGF